ncbi:hypothetical protein [Ancylobacter amanitiformis]|uniref:SGNH hydrolase-type esterase domain-containing protein n=1 Tax=Ancylobacter amanitiformis TaxID=217069 RepID=A0ABU0LM17_9HYPH|nr:hypothetical protein [Ancylobacter amanitiformis]MDQ0509757.1 hypothetical protein [Ancylobacter amanitiformis]
MSGEIDLAVPRTLSHAIGHDAQGYFGRQATDRLVRYAQSHAVPWERAGAVVDIDFIYDRASWYGLKFASIDRFLAAVGGTVLSGTGASRVIRLPWTDNSVYVVAEFINSAEAWASGSRYPYEFYSNDNNRMTASRTTSGFLGVAAVTAGTTSYLPAGFGPIGGPILRLAASYGATMRGAYNGQDAQLSTNWPGAPVVTNLVVGGDRNGANFGSPFRRFTIYADAVTDTARIKADSLPVWDCWVDGDSYGGGAGNPEVGFGRSLALLGWTPYMTAVGGSTLEQIKTRMLAAPAFAKALPTLWWDGDNNSYDATTANDVARHQAIITALGHTNYLIIPTAKREGQAALAQTAVTALTAALLAANPGKVLPPMPYLLSLGNGTTDNTAVANGNVPPSALADGVHLTSPAMSGIAALVDSAMRGAGWGMAA